MTGRIQASENRSTVRFELAADGQYPVLETGPGLGMRLEVPYPLSCSYLAGDSTRLRYSGVSEPGHGDTAGRLEWNHGAAFSLLDRWESVDDHCVRLERLLRITCSDEHPEGSDAFQFHLQFDVRGARSPAWRFFAPAMLYSAPGDFGDESSINTYMEDRLAYPLIMGYDPEEQRGVAIIRLTPARVVEPPVRPDREQRYAQITDIGSLGFAFADRGALSFSVYWPYFEGEKSVALNSSLSPASAFYPLNLRELEIRVCYELFVFEAPDFGDAVFQTYRHVERVAAPQPVTLPFSLTDAIEYRATSLRKTYREWEDGAGFFFSFDPTLGYGTPPSGFGTSFNTIPSDDYQRILEYGFTGRQLNAAYFLAKWYGSDWVERGSRVVDHFVQHCVHETGWLYSLYDVEERRPLYSFGGSEPALLHYGGQSQQFGNYLRTMVESAADLLLNYQFARSHGTSMSQWLDTCRAFGDFLVRHQNADGSWYRAYSPDGERILGDRWFGSDEQSAKSATAVPVALLVRLGQELEDDGSYLQAARKGGAYVLRHHVATDHYQGATLDNPNVIDKEAALYAMSALLTLYESLQEKELLVGAERAAKLAITWNYLWDPPFFTGTPLDILRFRATGWGGINSIWGGGVVDIYTLFYLADFHRLSVLTDEPLYATVARVIATGTQQLLSHPGDLLGYADIGMQPEGVGITNQGLDEKLIRKGDTWGSLGWIYSAGTCGLDAYLQESALAR